MSTGNPINATMGAYEWLMLLTLAAIWGGSFFFIEVALAAVPPMTLALLRVGFAAITLWLVIIVSGTIVVTLLVSYIALEESIAWNQMLGSACILLGIIFLFSN